MTGASTEFYNSDDDAEDSPKKTGFAKQDPAFKEVATSHYACVSIYCPVSAWNNHPYTRPNENTF